MTLQTNTIPQYDDTGIRRLAAAVVLAAAEAATVSNIKVPYAVALGANYWLAHHGLAWLDALDIGITPNDFQAWLRENTAALIAARAISEAAAPKKNRSN